MSKPTIIIQKEDTLEAALVKLDANPRMQTLMIEENGKIIGTLTDGDVRRGLIKGLDKSNTVKDFMHLSFTFLIKGKYEPEKIKFIKENKIKIVPELHEDHSLSRLINFNEVKTILPIDAIIMAGGKGTRLMPLTENTPKPMLKIGEQPIMEYNVDLLKQFGISHLTISVKYLADQIKTYFGNGLEKEIDIQYVSEDVPLGTIGAVKQIKHFYNDYILVMNSDLLTNINLETMFKELNSKDADMIVATTDYKVQIPYGVIEAEGNQIKALKEKPTYTYYSNAGIYIFKKELVALIPDNSFFNATDLLEKLIELNKLVLHYPIKNYWLDIGKHVDFEKAQNDVKNINFK
ncbi:nucleotidyltransferase [Putridiphycobacter roseus]|uniref:Nucleotidyltransferase n=1 Tax=Putridiphycobacter roseus TaxID=2219161 RepID=A0A2W1NLD8_9FLAO|nr:nucleotidyltransferase family protein [Putridiphycobacter roseus]PZE16472.1 nucleotidyltransferase [Putridiphycobacter roseus]